MKRRLVLGVIIAALCVYVVLLLPWMAEISKGPLVDAVRYECWKKYVCPFNDNVVYTGLASDRERDSLVIGLNVDELKARFGKIRGDSALPLTVVQRLYADLDYVGQDVRGLGDYNWLVILRNGRVVSLAWLKG